MGYTTSDVADMLGVEAVTIRKYALALEKAGYIVERDAGDRRAFSERDVMAFQQLKALRERSGMSVENSAIAVASKYKEASDSVALVNVDENNTDMQRYMKRYAELMDARITEIAVRIQQQTVEAVEEAIRKERGRRVDERLAEKRIERQLEREALAEWEKLPEERRTRKAGLFRREEDTVARDRFIRDYVDDRFEQRMKETFNP